MADNPRIEELRRRVLADPASIAFAALAEEYRRIGHYEDAIETCRTGLLRHPAYLSARVTLGRALIEMGDYEGAREELQTVLRSAPENLAAIRGLAQIHERMGHSAEMDPHLQALADEPMPAPVARAPEPVPAPEPEPVSAIASPPMEEPAAVEDPLAEFRFDEVPVEAPQPDLERIRVAPTTEAAAAALLLTGPPDEHDVDRDTLATLARLEQFLGAIRHARATVPSNL
jgi:FimV-like protein